MLFNNVVLATFEVQKQPYLTSGGRCTGQCMSRQYAHGNGWLAEWGGGQAD